MDIETRQRLVTQYKAGYQIVVDALAGATVRELDAVPAPGTWSARQVVHHLADSEMTAAVRLRLLIASDRPSIMGYDQDEFAARLYYKERSLESSLQAFRFARITTAEILDCLTEAEWQREGTHSEIGPYSVERWLQIYAEHAIGHAEQIRRARRGADT